MENLNGKWEKETWKIKNFKLKYFLENLNLKIVSTKKFPLKKKKSTSPHENIENIATQIALIWYSCNKIV